MPIPTENGSHWLVIHIEPRSSRLFYFDSYGLPPYIPAIQSFLKRKCTVWEYNKTLQGLIKTDCGQFRPLHGDITRLKNLLLSLTHVAKTDKYKISSDPNSGKYKAPPLPLCGAHVERVNLVLQNRKVFVFWGEEGGKFRHTNTS
jgi:hypothetical protein